MKKRLLFVFAFIVLCSPLAAVAQGYVPLVKGGIPGLTDPGTANSVISQRGLAAFMNQLYIFLIGIAVVLAIGMIIWGAVQITLQKDSVSAHSAGIQKIRNAIFGLTLVLSPVVVFTLINPAILNLNVNFPALDTKPGNYSPPPPASVPSAFQACGSSDSGCKDATAACNKYGVSKVVCLKSGVVDPTGGPSTAPIDFVTGGPGWSCVPGDTLAVQCP